MSKKNKVAPHIKVELVERFLRGEIGAGEAGRLSCIFAWSCKKSAKPHKKAVILFNN